MNTWKMCGSPIRDRWRFLHKDKLGPGFNGTDGDFFIIDMNNKIPVAYIDLKSGNGDDVTPTENVFYRWIANKGCPVYLLWIKDVEIGNFRIDLLDNFGKYEYFKEVKTWDEYKAWETEIRQQTNNHAQQTASAGRNIESIGQEQSWE
jgi:hypothetical protein